MAVPTGDRPDLLGRCLRSYADHAAHWGRTIRFVVVDDTSDHQGCNSTYDRLMAWMRPRRLSLTYLGARQKQDIKETLSTRTGTPRELLDFALSGRLPGLSIAGSLNTVGANRNWILWMTAGQRVLSVDDDTVCRTAIHPDSTPDVGSRSPTSYEDGWHYRHVIDRQEALALAPWHDLDLLAAHGDILGHAVSESALGEASQGRGGPVEAKVVMTLSGAVGDHGSQRPAGVLHLRGAARQHLWTDPKAYAMARRSRDAIKLVTRPMVLPPTSVPSAYHMAYGLGLDGRRPLPPFFPIGRNEEPLFASMLHAMYPDALACVLPAAILHDAQPRPPFDEDAIWRQAPGPRICELMHAVMGLWKPNPRLDPLHDLGSFWKQTAALPTVRYREVIRQAVQCVIERRRMHLKASLEASEGAPDLWVRDLRRRLETIRQTLTSPQLDSPIDLGPLRGDDARAAGRRMMGLFGKLVVVWPRWLEAARRLQGEWQDTI